jgi:hypothetical protein
MEYPERDCLDGSSSKELRATIVQQRADIEVVLRFVEAYDRYAPWHVLRADRATIDPILARYRTESEVDNG